MTEENTYICENTDICDMANITLSISQELQKEMKHFSEVKWSEVAREAIQKKIERLKNFEEVEKICQKSQLTKKDAKELANLVNASAAKRFREYVNNH